MKQNKNGFSLIEVLVAQSILFLLLATFIPIYTIITFEQTVLKNRIAITSALYDELQWNIWNNGSMDHETKDIGTQTSVSFIFTKEQKYIKGCANWRNVQEREEVVCLYGLDKE